jgi:TonB family protein
MSGAFAIAWLLLGQSSCGQALAAPDAAELCLADQQMRFGESQPQPQQRRQFEEAAEHAHRARSLAAGADISAAAADLLSRLYDERHLNEVDHEQAALLDLIALRPADLTPVARLANAQERAGLGGEAEETLLAARRRQPDNVESYRLLAQFYARRVTALHRAADPKKPEPPLGAVQPDENGVYRVGGSIAPPKRVDGPVYPPEAREAGIQGVVILEITIDEAGRVGDAKVLRSIPLLDQPAIDAVRRWQFVPSTLNGQAIKVKMAVTQNFTLK